MTDENLEEKIDIKKSSERTLGCSGMQTSESIPDTIKIETRRYPPEGIGADYVKIRGIDSCITLTHPIKDYNGKENYHLTLRAAWFSCGRSYYWNLGIDGEDRGTICWSDDFNELDEHFSSYTEERLKKWEKEGIKAHRQVLLRLEDLYWKGREITKDFLEHA